MMKSETHQMEIGNTTTQQYQPSTFEDKSNQKQECRKSLCNKNVEEFKARNDQNQKKKDFKYKIGNG